jgi:hypothetical protein
MIEALIAQRLDITDTYQILRNADFIKIKFFVKK